MNNKEISETLLEAYETLSPVEKTIVQLCSVIYEPTTPEMIFKCLLKTDITLGRGKQQKIKSVVPYLNHLRSLKLLNKSYQCHDAFVEVATRKALATAADGPSAFGHYGLMVNAVQGVKPLKSYYSYGSQGQYCWVVMRDLRIGIYTHDFKLYSERLNQIYSQCSKTFTEVHPLVRVCNNPFDGEWFRTLPPELQHEALVQIFFMALTQMVPDEDALSYAMDASNRSIIPEEKKPVLDYILSFRLLMGGRPEEAQHILSEMGDSLYNLGVQGGIHFMQGRNEEAIESFESDLKRLRKWSGRRKEYFRGFFGPIFILALLKTQDTSHERKIDGYIDTALNNEGENPFLSSVYNALKVMSLLQRYEVDVARLFLARNKEYGEGLSTLFSAIASYWLEGELSQEKIDLISKIFIKARDRDMKWVAMECAELLSRAEQSTPIRSNYIQKIREETGMPSFVSTLKVEEAWKKGLNALVHISSLDRSDSAKSAQARLVWLVDYDGGNLTLRPLEQKLTAKGTWSKGRAVSLSRLQSGTNLDYITRQDHLIRATLHKEYDYYYDSGYEFDMEKALPALVGHPLIFLEKSPSINVEFVKGEPEILVEQTGSRIRVKFSTPLTGGNVELVRETPTRFKVIELSEEHKRIAKILGERGLSVPETAKEEVLNAIGSISSLVTVHSDIGGKSKDIVEAEADPTPHLHLLPAGTGFRLEMFVKPFKDAGPHLKPGVGTANVIAEIDGKRMQAHRDLVLEESLAETVEGGCSILSKLPEPDRLWFLEDPEDCLQVLLDLKEMQEKGSLIVDWPEGEKLRVTREVAWDHLRMKIRGRSDWFELSGDLKVDDNLVLDMKQLLELLQSGRSRFIPLGDGQFLALTREFRKRLEELNSYSERRGKALRVHPLAALAIEDFTDRLTHLDADDAWKFRLKRIKDAQNFVPVVPSTLKAQLRDYQVEGFNWLARLAHLGVGACLADDMGLGKTLQALAIILDRAPQGPTLVVAPTSVCMNWISEANRFAPTLNLISFSGGNRESIVNDLKEMDVLVTSYGLLHQEAELLSSVEWRTIVLDEAQAIKNIATKRSQAAMGLKGEFKLITTGTPIENHLGEFYTLFDFINPGLLGSQDRFNARFAIPIEKYKDKDAGKRLKKLIRPFILRRIKSQVLEELPPRTEVILRVEMGVEEMAFYEALRRQALEKLEMDQGPPGQKHLKILAEIMKLRQACCNPKLVLPESNISSSKLQLFGDVVSEILESGHKALVFSQFVGHLSLIREYLDERSIDYRYLDGSTPPKERKKQVDAFQAGKGDLFLISLKAGGLGLNLTAADYVIHMDPWWNPAVEDQASDRAHRIGQLNPVTVYRLVTQNTIEEKIVKLHQDKRDLASSLLDGSDISGKISAEELLKLIRED